MVLNDNILKILNEKIYIYMFKKIISDIVFFLIKDIF